MDCCEPEVRGENGKDAGDSGCCHETGKSQLPGDIWLRLGIALVVAGQTMVWGLAFNLSSPPFGSRTYLIGHGWMILSTLLVGALLGPMLLGNAWNMVRRRKLTVEGLFLLTAFGAFSASLIATFTGEGSVYYEVVSVVLAVYVTGSFIGDRARAKTRQAVQSFEAQFEEAVVVSCCGSETTATVSSLEPGDEVLVYPGRPIPVDGRVVEGSSYLQESALSGEPLPRAVQPGDRVRAGSWSLDGRLKVEVEKASGSRELDRLIQLLENSRERPSRLERHADRIIQCFLPLVALTSLLTFLGWVAYIPWPRALFNSMAVLLVACPCALGLATPIAVWSGLWRLFQIGIISRSSALLDGLSDTRRLFFDKTGTLSESEVRVLHFHPDPRCSYSIETIATLVELLERGQEHPLGRALAGWAGAGKTENSAWSLVESRLHPGCGLAGTVKTPDGSRLRIRLGSRPWLKNNASNPTEQKWIGLEINDQWVGEFELQEQLREQLEELFAALKARGIASEILTGDPDPAWTHLQGIPVIAGCSPEEKQQRVEASFDRGDSPFFIGDGINDTAAMKAAVASLALANGPEFTQTLGSGVLRETAFPRIPEAIDISRSIQKTLKQNLWFAAFYNVIGMGLAAAGFLHPVVAALLMVGSSLVVSSRAAASAGKARNPSLPSLTKSLDTQGSLSKNKSPAGVGETREVFTPAE